MGNETRERSPERRLAGWQGRGEGGDSRVPSGGRRPGASSVFSPTILGQAF